MRTISIPFVPLIIDIEAVAANDGNLLSKDQIAKLQEMKLEPNKIYNKKYFAEHYPELKIKHDIIALPDIYAIYVDNVLGEGSFGKVQLIQNARSIHWSVIKKQFVDDKIHPEKEIENEIELLIKLNRSPINQPHHRYSPKKQRKQIPLVTELATGVELLDFILYEMKLGESSNYLSYPIISPIVRAQIAYEITKEVQALIDKNILHCDLKPGNVIVDFFRKIVSLVDFGYALQCQNGEKKVEHPRGGSIYMAPELRENIVIWQVHGKADFEFKAKTEMYSLGILFAQFFGLLDEEKIDKRQAPPIVTDESHPIFTKNHSLPPLQLKKMLVLIQEMTKVDPDERCNDFAFVLQQIKNIVTKLTQTEKLNIGLLDVDDYFGMAIKDRITLPSIWEHCHQIVLVETGRVARNPFEYADIKRLFEQQYRVVHDKVQHGPSITAIAEQLKKELKPYEQVIIRPTAILHGRVAGEDQNNIKNMRA